MLVLCQERMRHCEAAQSEPNWQSHHLLNASPQPAAIASQLRIVRHQQVAELCSCITDQNLKVAKNASCFAREGALQHISTT